MRNKLWLSCAKLKLGYIAVIVDVVVKIGEEAVVVAIAQLLVRQVGGWVVGWNKIKAKLSFQLINEVEYA